MTTLIGFIVLLCVGVIFGGINERRHFKRLREEEASLSHLVQTNLKVIPDVQAQDLEPDCLLVSGNVVVAMDYFKKIAIVRMLKEADAMGATAVHNIRIEFSTIAGSNPSAPGASAPGGAEILAYGTAVKSRT